ncbi:hypothetical protein STEG23_007805, partial [Scotinomys teguina]
FSPRIPPCRLLYFSNTRDNLAKPSKGPLTAIVRSFLPATLTQVTALGTTSAASCEWQTVFHSRKPTRDCENRCLRCADTGENGRHGEATHLLSTQKILGSAMNKKQNVWTWNVLTCLDISCPRNESQKQILVTQQLCANAYIQSLNVGQTHSEHSIARQLQDGDMSESRTVRATQRSPALKKKKEEEEEEEEEKKEEEEKNEEEEEKKKEKEEEKKEEEEEEEEEEKKNFRDNKVISHVL